MIEPRRLKWAGYVARIGGMRNIYEVFVGKPEGKRPLGKPSCRREDNIRIGIRGIGWEIVDCRHWLRIGISGRNF
jgi:hypothetical protein